MKFIIKVILLSSLSQCAMASGFIDAYNAKFSAKEQVLLKKAEKFKSHVFGKYLTPGLSFGINKALNGISHSCQKAKNIKTPKCLKAQKRVVAELKEKGLKNARISDFNNPDFYTLFDGLNSFRRAETVFINSYPDKDFEHDEEGVAFAKRILSKRNQERDETRESIPKTRGSYNYD